MELSGEPTVNGCNDVRGRKHPNRTFFPQFALMRQHRDDNILGHKVNTSICRKSSMEITFNIRHMLTIGTTICKPSKVAVTDPVCQSSRGKLPCQRWCEGLSRTSNAAQIAMYQFIIVRDVSPHCQSTPWLQHPQHLP